MQFNTKPVGIAGVISIAVALLTFIASAPASQLLVQGGVPQVTAGHIVAWAAFLLGVLGAAGTYFGRPFTVPDAPSAPPSAPTSNLNVVKGLVLAFLIAGTLIATACTPQQYAQIGQQVESVVNGLQDNLAEGATIQNVRQINGKPVNVVIIAGDNVSPAFLAQVLALANGTPSPSPSPSASPSVAPTAAPSVAPSAALSPAASPSSSASP